jgi:VCBS repeat protein
MPTFLKAIAAATTLSIAAQPASLPRFDRVVLLETTSETSANVHIGDVNGDGHLDIVLAKGRHWGLVDRVLIGDGRGGFPSAYDLGPAADKTYSGNLVDLDRDGDLDVVISNDTPDPKRIYLNDGKGRFRQVDTYGRAQWSTRNAAVADVNGDTLPDIIVANRDAPARAGNYICLNRGNGQFDDDCFMFSKESATTITPADVNRDGRVDLVVPHRDGGQSHVYLNGSSGSALSFSPIAFGPGDAAIRASAAADLDRDGLIDIVAIDERLGVFAFFGERGHKWSAAVPIGPRGRTPYALAVHDVNGDGTIDVVVGHVEAPSTVFFTAAAGRSFTPVDFGDGKGTAYGFDIADLNEDGRLDIAMARSDAPNVVYYGGPAASK